MKHNFASPLRSLFKTTAAICLTGMVGMSPALANDYPGSRPVSLMVPYPAGGPSDVSARILSEPISKALGAPVIVENLGGGTGTIAASKVLNANANGRIFFRALKMN